MTGSKGEPKGSPTLTCQIQWIGPDGKPTPDSNPAVGVAHVHKAIWLFPYGNPANKIIGYSDEIDQSFYICADHLSRMPKLNWSFTPFAQD